MAGPIYTLSGLAAALGFDFAGDGALPLVGAAHPSEAGADDLAIATSPEFEAQLSGGSARCAMLAQGSDHTALGLEGALFAERPRYALAHISRAFSDPDPLFDGVHPMACIDAGAELGEGVRVGPFVHIAAGAMIGAGTQIHSHVSVGAEAQIGEGGLIHAGARIGSRVRIGARAIIHQNAVIGADGFSFVTPQPGAVETAEAEGGSKVSGSNTGLARIFSLAAVTLGDDVEIGANVAIDRGTLKDTSIGHGTKLDNLVQIGHNVSIGRGCMLCGQVGVSGSAQIGDRVVLGGKSGVADHVKIGSDVLVGAGSGVASNVSSRSIVVGYPAIPRDEAMKQVLALRRLPRMIDAVNALKKRLSAMDRA